MTEQTHNKTTHYQITNPATGEVEERFDTATDAEIEQIIEKADTAFQSWRKTDLAERKKILLAIADEFDAQKDTIAAIITAEMGKPIAQAYGELAVVSDIYRYYAEKAEQLLAPKEISVEQGSAKIKKQPVGVLLGIMPWNFPQYQVARFTAPNFMAGNTIILKHAEQCPKTAAIIEDIYKKAGLPDGVYNNAYASIDQAASIIEDKRVQGVSLTGSERAGASVAQTAGKSIKKVVLELGGSDAFIVMDDADIDKAIGNAITGRFGNTGQACNAAKRIIVTENKYDEFVEKFVGAVSGIKPTDPTKEESVIGPLSSRQAAVTLQKQLDTAIAEGATVLLEGGMHKDQADNAAWFDPAILTDIKPGMKAYSQELFGPVAVIYKVKDIEEAIALANDSPFGLGASIQGNDMAEIERIANELEVGMVTINQASSSEAETPFGGVKNSGFGRELGELGITEFLNYKLVRDLS